MLLDNFVQIEFFIILHVRYRDIKQLVQLLPSTFPLYDHTTDSTMDL